MEAIVSRIHKDSKLVLLFGLFRAQDVVRGQRKGRFVVAEGKEMPSDGHYLEMVLSFDTHLINDVLYTYKEISNLTAYHAWWLDFQFT